jgi:NADP-dependent 3-hydroxy acid dehydrogenase YdfG
MKNLDGKIAWITGAGTGIGEAAAEAIAREGGIVVLSGRRKEPLESVAAKIKKAGGKAWVLAVDVTKAAAVQKVADAIRAEQGRIDNVVNNAGMNIAERAWSKLTADNAGAVIEGNLTSAFYLVQAALPVMRAQKDGLFIHTASWAGRFVSPVSGPAYTAAKHGMVAMSHSLNLEECRNGIRSCVVCPGEVATPILVNRPIPETPETLARMIQPADMGSIVAFVAAQPAHVCINEIVVSPTHNRGYIGIMQAREAAMAAIRKS